MGFAQGAYRVPGLAAHRVARKISRREGTLPEMRPRPAVVKSRSYGNSECQAVPALLPGMQREFHRYGRSSQRRQCGWLPGRCCGPARSQSLPGSESLTLQSARRPAEAEEGQVRISFQVRACKFRKARSPSCPTSGSSSWLNFSSCGASLLSPLRAITLAR